MVFEILEDRLGKNVILTNLADARCQGCLMNTLVWCCELVMPRTAGCVYRLVNPSTRLDLVEI